MTNEIEIAGKAGPLAGIMDMGQSVVSSKETRLPLSGSGSKKGNYFVGKYLGTSSFKYAVPDDAKGETEMDEKTGKKMKKMTVARFAVLETNMEGDSGPVIPGEICSVPFSGLLAWGLQKIALGRMVAVRFDGKGPATAKDGSSRDMNRFTVTDVTDALAAKGIS